MQKVSYMGDGTTTEFFFTFPFFENSNVIVTVNDEPAMDYTIIGTPGGLDADIPYIGGKVVFEVAPTSIDCITIARQLPLERIVDYQPLSKIDPTTLNQDLNYLMEVIKDRKDELLDLTTKYAEIADKESTEIILSRITAIHEEIVDIDAKIQALGDIGTLQQRVTDLTTTVGGHTTSINGLDTQKSNIDMDNLSNTGKNEITHLSMPSTRYVDLTLGASGTSYTAPADGWLFLNKTVGTTNTRIEMYNSNTGVRTVTPTGGLSITGWTYCSIQVNKGDGVQVSYNVTGDTNSFRFIYANGAQ